MTAAIRNVTMADRFEYVRMRCALWPEASAAEHDADLPAHLAGRPDRATFVAVLPDGRLCGFSEVALRAWAEGVDAQPAAFLEGLYVDPDVRQQGIARQLVDACDEWAASRGSPGLGSDTQLENTLSQAVHARLGFREIERTVVYARPVSAPVRPAAVRRGSLRDAIPAALPDELFTTLCFGAAMRAERIVSRGHASPPDFWYCQDEDELVLLLAGAARLELDGQGELSLAPGDWIDLPRGVRHRVSHTAPDIDTIWLAIFRG
jgi:aminoglycoside 6'-N-acetyltransferase I